MEIGEFTKLTRFSIKRIIDFERMTIDHFVQTSKESDLDVLTEEVYNDMIQYLRGRLKLVKRFIKTSDKTAEEISTVYIASSKEIGEMLNTFVNTLTKEQQQQTVKYFLNAKSNKNEK